MKIMRQEGFTLFELVIIIVAALSTILGGYVVYLLILALQHYIAT